MSAEPFALARRGLPLAGYPRRRAPAPWLASFAFPRARAADAQLDAWPEAQPELWAEGPAANERLPEEPRIETREEEVKEEEEEDTVPAQPRKTLASSKSRRVEIAAAPSGQAEPAAGSDMPASPDSPDSPHLPGSPRAERRHVAATEAQQDFAAATRASLPARASPARQVFRTTEAAGTTSASGPLKTIRRTTLAAIERRARPQAREPAGPAPAGAATLTMPMGAPQGMRQAAQAQHEEPRIHAALAAAAAAQRRERAHAAAAGGRAGARAGVTRIGTVHVVVQAPPPQPARPAAPAAAQAALQPPPGAARRPAPAFRSPWSSRRRGE